MVQNIERQLEALGVDYKGYSLYIKDCGDYCDLFAMSYSTFKLERKLGRYYKKLDTVFTA